MQATTVLQLPLFNICDFALRNIHMQQVRRVDLKTGKVLHKSPKLPQKFFGEGMTILDDVVHQITWQGKQGFTYNVTDLAPLSTFHYTTRY
jgi:glutaminyl-peptide cyclotransferase